MSTNIDINNQNIVSHNENDNSNNVTSKELVISVSANGTGREIPNTQMEENSSLSNNDEGCDLQADSAAVDNAHDVDRRPDPNSNNSNVEEVKIGEQGDMEHCSSTASSESAMHTPEDGISYNSTGNDMIAAINNQTADKPNSDSTISSHSIGESNESASNNNTSANASQNSHLQTPDSLMSTDKLSSATSPSSQSDVSFTSQSSNNALATNSDSSCKADTASYNDGFTMTVPDQEQAGSSGVKDQSPSQSTYHIKWIKFRDESCPIITQNENGPCPLIAIMNVLLLQRKVKFPPMMEMVTSNQLMDYLGDCILEYAPKNITEDALLNYEQNMHDAMAVFHKLQTGLDVNVRFTGVSTFEYTSECIVFDLLEIPLYHGWLVDPEDQPQVMAVGNNSYNQLVEKIICQKNSQSEEQVREALVAEDFLNRSSHQLTYHGLSELASTVKENMLCVFFRNNHFSTLHKHKNELFLLVTDQGFLTESSVVWETLSNVEGDGHFVNASFHTYRKPEPSTHVIPPANLPEGPHQIDQDYLVALSLQQEQQCEIQSVTPEWQPQLSDHEYALKLQEEEDRRAAAAQQQQQQQQQQPGRQAPQASASQQSRQQRPARGEPSAKKEKASECVIL